MTSDVLRRHLAVLGLPPGADLDAARTARRALLKEWHPDRFPSGSAEAARATEHAKSINEAFREIEHAAATGAARPPDIDPREWAYHSPGAEDLLPLGFRDLAWRLRAGERPLDLRNEIVARDRIPKVTAARRVENVQRALRAARAGLGGGALTLVVALAYAWSGHVGPVTVAYIVLIALGQAVPAALTLRVARRPAS